MASFGSMQENLRLLLSGNAAAADIKSWLNRAQEQILEAYDWSFLLTNTVVNSAAPKTTGLITVSQGSPLVLGTGTSFGVQDIDAFMWVGGLSVPPIPIASVQGTASLSLSNPWAGPTMVKTGYVIAPLYYLVADSLEVKAVRQIQDLAKVSREYLNQRDPARIAQGGSPASAWAMAPASADGSLQIELWPVPTDTRPYLIEFKRKAPALQNETDLPLCPSSVIEAKAAIAACRAMYGSTAQSSWLELADRYLVDYRDEMEHAQTQDRKIAQHANQVTAPGRQISNAFDALFDSNHDMF